jgi:hypothetical protein
MRTAERAAARDQAASRSAAVGADGRGSRVGNARRIARAAGRWLDLDGLGYSDKDLLYILFGVPDGRMIRKL